MFSPMEENSHLFLSTGEWARGYWLITWLRRFRVHNEFHNWQVSWTLDPLTKCSVNGVKCPSLEAIRHICLAEYKCCTPRRVKNGQLMAGFLHSSLAVFILNPISVLRRWSRFPTAILKMASLFTSFSWKREEWGNFLEKNVWFIYRKRHVARISAIRVNIMYLKTETFTLEQLSLFFPLTKCVWCGGFWYFSWHILMKKNRFNDI